MTTEGSAAETPRRPPRPEREPRPEPGDNAAALADVPMDATLPAEAGEPAEADRDEQRRRRRRRCGRGGRDEGAAPATEGLPEAVAEGGDTAEPKAGAEGQAPAGADDAAAGEEGRRRGRGRDRQRRERRDVEPREDGNGSAMQATEAGGNGALLAETAAETDTPHVAPATAAPPAAVIEAAPAAAPVPKVLIEPYVLPLDALQRIAESSGLQWVNSDADKIRAAQEAIASEPKPVHAPRQRKPLAVVDEGPLVLVETRKDLSQLKLPFESGASAPR